MSRRLVLLIFVITNIAGLLNVRVTICLAEPYCEYAADFQKGMSYTTYAFKNRSDQYESLESDESLESMRRVGIEWVALNVVWYQDDFTSTTIYPDYEEYSPTDESVIHAINKCHALNMGVMLKPKIDCKTGWSAYIEPSSDWFGNYTSFIVHFAEMAEECNVEMLCIGTELNRTVSCEQEWRNIVSSVRQHYSGLLTYAADWWEEYNKSVTWWDALDYVGIDAYFPLSDKADPTINEMKTTWESIADYLDSFHTKVEKPIIFTEIGYQAVDGTNIEPWNYTRMFDPKFELDLQEQADCYEAVFQTLCNKTWFKGMFWWYWQTDPNPTDPTKNATLALRDYTPQNKPAQGVLTHWYYVISEFPSFLILPLFMLVTILAVIIYKRKHVRVHTSQHF